MSRSALHHRRRGNRAGGPIIGPRAVYGMRDPLDCSRGIMLAAVWGAVVWLAVINLVIL